MTTQALQQGYLWSPCQSHSNGSCGNGSPNKIREVEKAVDPNKTTVAWRLPYVFAWNDVLPQLNITIMDVNQKLRHTVLVFTYNLLLANICSRSSARKISLQVDLHPNDCHGQIMVFWLLGASVLFGSINLERCLYSQTGNRVQL